MGIYNQVHDRSTHIIPLALLILILILNRGFLLPSITFPLYYLCHLDFSTHLGTLGNNLKPDPGLETERMLRKPESTDDLTSPWKLSDMVVDWIHSPRLI